MTAGCSIPATAGPLCDSEGDPLVIRHDTADVRLVGRRRRNLVAHKQESKPHVDISSGRWTDVA